MNNEVIEYYFGRISKKVVALALCVCTMFFITSGCGKHIDTEINAMEVAECAGMSTGYGGADCPTVPFMEGVSRHSNCGCHIIRGKFRILFITVIIEERGSPSDLKKI